MSSPGEVLGDVSATAVDPLHWSPVDGDVGVLTGPSPDIHHQLLGITDVVVVAPVSQGVHLFSVSQFIIIGDQTDHRCVTRKFDDDVGAVRGYTVVRVQRVQERAENTALRGSSVVGQRGGDVAAYSDHLTARNPGSSCTEICSDLEHYKLRGHYGITH